MAFNWKTFQTRTLTAIIFAGVMLTGLLWNNGALLPCFPLFILVVGGNILTCWKKFIRQFITWLHVSAL